MNMIDTSRRYALTGVGPAELAEARNRDKQAIPFFGLDAGPTAGGLWNIDYSRTILRRHISDLCRGDAH